ncbi:MAG: FMN-binding glutamate synthase family protein [Acidimicrobiia bacterium]|nr:FMN-binding glutamate synthase family protein [Acidimicrobiia bacterium]
MRTFLRFGPFGTCVLLAIFGTVLAVVVSPLWWILGGPMLALSAVGVWNLLQREHTVLRNYPVIGHARYIAEFIRPEVLQYFVENDTEGVPFDRDTRATVYSRAKGESDKKSFGTERDLYQVGAEFLTHSVTSRIDTLPGLRITVGGPQCDHPYDMSILNVSAMSFGSLSANAILALNGGAKLGGFSHDTGEGGISEYHRRPGGDLVWEVGTGYFGCRTADGNFDPGLFAEKASEPQVKMVSLKLSQGAKPGLGGVMPGAKVTPEIAAIRGLPVGVDCISPPSHSAFSTPIEMMEFLAKFRELAGGKPMGIKLCVGRKVEFLAMIKAMLATGIYPDFVSIDGAEGGTGAAPQEFEDNIGLPLTDGLMFARNALSGAGIRHHIRIGAAGKIATGSDIVKRIIQGADYALSARAMMFAVGCIQATKCHTNHCPTGVTTQDPKRMRALDVVDKTERVYKYHQKTVMSAARIVASLGVDHTDELHPSMLIRRVSPTETSSYAELYPSLESGQLLDDPPPGWRADWNRARAEEF